MKTLTLIQFKSLKYNFDKYVEGKEDHFEDYFQELNFFITNLLNNRNWEVYVSPREQCFIEDEFIIWAAETGRDREACFDFEADQHQFITDTLQTENWRME